MDKVDNKEAKAAEQTTSRSPPTKERGDSHEMALSCVFDTESGPQIVLLCILSTDLGLSLR